MFLKANNMFGTGLFEICTFELPYYSRGVYINEYIRSNTHTVHKFKFLDFHSIVKSKHVKYNTFYASYCIIGALRKFQSST